MYQSNAKKTWQVIKEVIGKTKLQHSTFPKMLLINKIETFDKTSIANNFNKYFTEIGPNLANKIDPSINSYETYLTRSNTIINNANPTEEEFVTAFKSLKSNKATPYDDLSSNVIKNIYDEIKITLMHIFNKSLQKGIFPDKRKIAKVIPVFKSG